LCKKLKQKIDITIWLTRKQLTHAKEVMNSFVYIEYAAKTTERIAKKYINNFFFKESVPNSLGTLFFRNPFHAAKVHAVHFEALITKIFTH
jgi:hypothetical protein